MDINTCQTIGLDKPLGDREGAQEDWSPETVKGISNEEVKNPHDEPEPAPEPGPGPERDVEESERKD